MYTMQEEVVTPELFDEIMPLLEEHRQELSAFDDMALNPSVQKYVLLTSMGMFRFFSARDDNNKLIAYLAYFIHPNMHYSDYTYAVQDVFYTVSTVRGSLIGMRLIAFADDRLKEAGVNVVTQHVKVAKDFEPMLKRLGYRWVEKIYMKRIN